MTARKTAAPKIAASFDVLTPTPPEPIDTRQYETLNGRVNGFHSVYLEGKIVLEVTEDAARIFAQARVYTADDIDSFKGIGFARVASGPNADMIAQDLAIGRALANAGLHSGERQTKEEKEYTEHLIFPRLIAAGEDDPGLTAQERRQRRALEGRQERAAVLPDSLPESLEPLEPAEAAAAGDPEEEIPLGTFGCTQCSKPITAKQKTGSMKNFGIALCAAHERETRRNVAMGE